MLSVTTPIFGSDHRPNVSSPLSSSPIRASSPPSSADRISLPQRQIQSSPIQRPKFKFASRPTRKNPLLQNWDDAAGHRRRKFLQIVRQKQDEMVWLRRDIEGQFLKKNLLADIGRLSHDAPAFSDTDLEDAMAFQEEPTKNHDLMDETYEETEEFEAMVASYEQQSQVDKRPPSPLPSPSDDEYDEVFAELIAQEEAQLQSQSSGEQMDMS
ncbi:hypothetical protein NOR_03450 [Metarhizium rileyi]|uniref:Uncharacterized protein n=1 Tax=Metarhizium rileyi (strain RCEF 4871) TaxID=1649241 RepID=A0A167FRV1_METRR|nr:hypothetical protein NOR_03450 [Metarhizium rileyi RCEF 4871]